MDFKYIQCDIVLDVLKRVPTSKAFCDDSRPFSIILMTFDSTFLARYDPPYLIPVVGVLGEDVANSVK